MSEAPLYMQILDTDEIAKGWEVVNGVSSVLS